MGLSTAPIHSAPNRCIAALPKSLKLLDFWEQISSNSPVTSQPRFHRPSSPRLLLCGPTGFANPCSWFVPWDCASEPPGGRPLGLKAIARSFPRNCARGGGPIAEKAFFGRHARRLLTPSHPVNLFALVLVMAQLIGILLNCMQLLLNPMQLPANAPEANREDYHCGNQYWIDTQCYGLPPPRISVGNGRKSQGCKYAGSISSISRETARPKARRCFF